MIAIKAIKKTRRQLGRIVFVFSLCLPTMAYAYVGPGAGVAFITTALMLLTTSLLVLLGLLLWPFRQVYRLITQKKPPQKPQITKAVIVGLDGLDPDLAKRFMEKGKMPFLQKLAEKGGFQKLGTTFPSMSPVAWSSFATGVHPSKHGIFDFLTRDPRTYLPELSSADVGAPARHIKLGSYQIPIGKPRIKLLRKSKPFWKLLSNYRIPCSILRVPITFPPEPFEGGTMLSAMCVPDLQGSQGTFTYFSSAKEDEDAIGGQKLPVTRIGEDKVEGALIGPPNPIRTDGQTLKLTFSARIFADKKTAELSVGKETILLKLDQYSDWTPIAFPMGLGLKLRGMCRFRLLEVSPNFRLYVSPINIDPSRPIMPISHPFLFSVFLSKLCGRFATLGLAEDTWALNEGVLDEEAFLEQAWDNHAERESMFFEMLRRTPKGLISCVFDGTDRIQHMFMRYLDNDHPAAKNDPNSKKYESVIEDTYHRVDQMVGKVMEKIDIDDPETLLLVISDHGFKTFRRGININSWLYQNGYLVLDEGRKESGEWFQGVDWKKSHAYALGLGGIFLNIKGREAHGLVEPGEEAQKLSEEIAQKLTGLIDPEIEKISIREVYPAHQIYRGPYAEDAPDLIVGYQAGWRASWSGVRGIVDDVVFEDNTKAWSGDHCIDPKLVPGVLFSNQKLGTKEREASIADIAPTMLNLFGIPAPRYMDGQSLVTE